jgi:UDP-N-acetylglucosamine--N-acetylmuramyl-(pentapeptide) pyrophosphoryl-undecaprenol N-acetylglucosamine transferase
MKIFFAGGGTAGHVNPALAAANYIRERDPSAAISFSGGTGRIEEVLAARAGYPIYAFPLQGLSRELSPSGIRRNLTALYQTASAIREAKEIIRREKPDVVVGTGGYASFPMVYAAAQLGVKTALLEVNATPGMALKRLSKKVDCVMVAFEETAQHLTGAKRVEVTGSPVRAEILRCRDNLYEPVFENSDRPLVTCFWGSVGALYMNKKMEEVIRLTAKSGSFDLLHSVGSSAWEWLPGEVRDLGVDLDNCPNVRVQEYIYDMDRVLAQSDLVICRAGASTLAEICAAGVPAIIVPSPYVADNHQEKNARLLEKAGAAIVLTEQDCTPELLYDTVQGLLANPEKLRRMGEKAREKAQPNALDKICAIIRELAQNH